MNRKLNVIVTCLVLLASASAYADVFAIGPWGSFTRADLYSINTSTGAATVIGNTRIQKASALTYDATTDTMYAFTTVADLYSVDIATGASTNVQYVSATIGEGGMAAKDGLLYLCDGYDLFTINPTNGNWSTIGTMDLGSLAGTVNDISGLAFAPDGFLYGYTKNGTLEDSLVKINPETAAVELIGGVGIQTLSVGGMVYDYDSNQMLLSDGSVLYSVDLATAATTTIGSHGGGVSGLAYVPEPATALLLAVGSLIAVRRKRK